MSIDLAVLLGLLGVNLALWTVIGGARLTSDRVERVRRRGTRSNGLTPGDVAVLIPAHNEEPVIGATIDAVLRLVPAEQIHVVADGCLDRTATIARSLGARVLDVRPGRGKAAGIEQALAYFRLPERFKVLLIVDADTEIDPHYLDKGLPLLDRPGMVALAGYARSSWRPREMSPGGRFLVAYRSRLYLVMQWLKYGQTWRRTNVTSIVPGFASMYRTDALTSMDLNPPGLVIEDFNMTFEIHHKRLGKIAHHPSAYATTQDPDRFRDYYRQVVRWQLGFWQTLVRHGLWPGWFSLALALFVAEVLVASVGIVVLVGSLAVLTPFILGGEAFWIFGLGGDPTGLEQFYGVLLAGLLLLVIFDYLLTCLTAAALRRPSLLLYGLGFVALRFVDATAALWALPQVWLRSSSGQWASPARRPVLPSPEQTAARGEPGGAA